MKNGIYRNSRGAELEVTGFLVNVGTYKTLGDTYEAVARDSLFGNTYYVVTKKSLKDSGYTLVSETGSEATT